MTMCIYKSGNPKIITPYPITPHPSLIVESQASEHKGSVEMSRMRPDPTNNPVEMSSRFGEHINAGFVRV